MDNPGSVIRFNGAALHAARKGRRLSLSHLAELITRETGERITYNAIHRWEKGLGEPRFSHAVAAARLVRLPLDRFIQLHTP